MKAVMFVLHSDGHTTTDVDERPGCLDRMHALADSCRDDFPSALFAVTADEEATEERKRRILRGFGFTDDEGGER